MLAEDYNITLEEALEKTKHRPDFQKKIKHSVELLRKAKDLALKYSDDGFYLAFSGGKDSQCLYHVAELAGVPFKAYMNLTSIDPPQVILFVKRNYPSVVLNKPIDSIYNIAVERKYLLPSRIIRWCCQELKEGGGAGTVCLTGIRKAESTRRAKRSPVEVSNRSFAGDLEQFHDWQAEQIKKKFPNLNIDQFAEGGGRERSALRQRERQNHHQSDYGMERPRRVGVPKQGGACSALRAVRHGLASHRLYLLSDVKL